MNLQLNIDPDFIVHRKYMGAAKYLNPILFWDGEKYCCLLGPNGDVGLLISADTPIRALRQWNISLVMRLQVANENDFIYKYVQNMISNASSEQRVRDISDHTGLFKK